MAQKILVMSTKRSDPRSEAIGWSAEDGDVIVPGRPIGESPGFRGPYSYDTPMHAIRDGWRLLAPPKEYQQEYLSGARAEWEWWLTKD
jgi:hypothetical protein